ncbi:MAG: PKD domain-containing protein [Bacteroidia bacterium]|nr:PKD domain-containing protein [Bacteroidia bacterium]
MKTILSIMLFLLAGFTGWAQPGNPYNLVIRGHIQNLSTGLPMAYHPVFATKLPVTGTSVVATSTDSLGNYAFEIINGSINGQNAEFRVYTYNCDSTVRKVEFSNQQGSIDLKEVNFDLCANLPPPCQAYFSYTFSPVNPLKVNFTNQSPGREDSSALFFWSFGDGTSAQTLNAEHVYATPGTYEACLSITRGTCTKSFCKLIVVGSNQEFCKSAFSIVSTPGTNIRKGKPEAPYNENYQYVWVVNNLTILDYDPILPFIQGWNSVCLTVSKGNECHTMTCDSAFVPEGPCRAEFSFHPAPNTPNRMIFVNESNGRFDSTMAFRWTFGDGSVAESPNAEHTYTAPGSYNVCLVISSPSCVDTVCKQIVVGTPPPTCDAGFTFADFRRAPAAVQFFSVPGQNTDHHLWIIDGRDTIRGNPNPVYTFTHPGEYSVCHFLSNSTTNCQKQECRIVHILPSDSTRCEARFTATPSSAAPMRWIFNNQSVRADSAILQSKWVFGDGSAPFIGLNAEHTFPGPGTYTVCLFIESAGCTDHKCMTIVVQGPSNACNAEFQWNRLPDQQAFKVAFHSVSNPNINMSHYWSFSNTNHSELPNPVFTFPGPGTYNVCHVVYNPAGMCRDTVCRQIVLLPVPDDTLGCYAKFIWVSSEHNALRVNFKNQSSPGEYRWTFGDSTISEQPNPQHLYAAPGSYQVCLRVKRGNCVDEFCANVNVAPGDTNGYQIGGQVFAGANTADVAKVNLIRRDPVSHALYVFRTTLVDSSGRYVFNHIPSGVYLIRAGLLAPSAYFHNYVPTYFGSQYYWQFAEPVVVNADGNTYHISLIYSGNVGGPGGVGGGITGPIRTEGPINEATVIVTNLFDGPQRWTRTDENGQFSISDLAYGTYRLWADYEGMVCVPVEFTITAENPDVNFVLNLGEEIITIIQETKASIYRGVLFPNPANTQVNLEVNMGNATLLEMQVFNLTGQLVQAQTTQTAPGLQTIQMGVADLTSGIYLMTIRDAKSGTLIDSRKFTISH